MTDETLLLRQIHPSFVQQGRATSQAFRPTPKDKNRLSTYNGDLIDPESAWQHYTVTYLSVGVMAVSVEECTNIGLPAVPDPEPFPEHAVIDFSGAEKNRHEKLSKKLRDKAALRGWLYRVGTTSP